MKLTTTIEAKLNLEINLIDRGKRRVWHQNTHNIVVNTGRQFLAEVITASSFGPGSFVRTQDTCVRYIGFGIGGTRQTRADASAPPYSDLYPAGYGGTNVQTDTDVTVSKVERPVLVSTGPDVWMKEISAPGTFTAAERTKFIATFSPTELNLGAFVSVPLSEIGLYKSSADPSLPNGGAGAYPGPAGHLIAYDTFDTISKTGVFSIEVLWEWRF